MDWIQKAKSILVNPSREGDIFGVREGNSSLSLCWDESGLDGYDLSSPSESNEWDFKTSLVTCAMNDQANASTRNPLLEHTLGTRQVQDVTQKESFCAFTLFPLAIVCPPSHSGWVAQGNIRNIGIVDLGDKRLAQIRVQSVLCSPIAKPKSSSAIIEGGGAENQTLKLKQAKSRPLKEAMTTERDFTTRCDSPGDSTAASQSRGIGYLRCRPRLVSTECIERSFLRNHLHALTSISLMMRPYPEGPSRQDIKTLSTRAKDDLENTRGSLARRGPESVLRYAKDTGASCPDSVIVVKNDVRCPKCLPIVLRA